MFTLRSVIRRGYTRYIIVALWTASALASIPNAIQVKYMNVAPKDQTEMWVCTTGISFSSCQRNLIKTFQIEGMITLITKMTLIF